METTVTVCYVCKAPGLPTQRYRVERVGASERVVDLCSDDAAPIENVLKYADEPAAEAEAVAAPQTASTRRSRKRKVVTLDEIEKVKTAGPTSSRRPSKRKVVTLDEIEKAKTAQPEGSGQ